jgi:hypothetical protein
MFGLRVKEPYSGYVGWRAIYNNRYIDILPDRGSRYGSEDVIANLTDWVDTLCRVGEEKRGKSPWNRMLKEVPEKLSTTDRDTWEFRSGDNCLRASPNASYGYLYIALFKIDETQANNIEL